MRQRNYDLMCAVNKLIGELDGSHTCVTMVPEPGTEWCFVDKCGRAPCLTAQSITHFQTLLDVIVDYSMELSLFRGKIKRLRRKLHKAKLLVAKLTVVTDFAQAEQRVLTDALQDVEPDGEQV